MRFGLLLLLAGCRNILGLHDPQLLISDADTDAAGDGCASFSIFIDTCALPAGAPMPADATAYNSDTGMVTSGSAPVAMPHMMLTSTQGDVVDAVAISGDWTERSATTMRITGKLPVVFAVVGDVTIDGTIDLSAGGAGAGCVQGSGMDATSSNGGGGGGGAALSFGSGGAGGGFANSGGAAQTAFTGGCAGGKGGFGGAAAGGAGGGALYVVTTNTIVIDGTIDASGGGGLGGQGDIIFTAFGGGGGGGGGGSLRFEALTITTGQDSMIEAGGGGGGGGGDSTASGLAGKAGLLGGIGGTSAGNAGGNGARLVAAKPGAAGNAGGGGGGGGGDGSIHFATTPTQLEGVVIPPAN